MPERENYFKFVLKLQSTVFLNAIRLFLDFAHIFKKWLIFALLLYFLCAKDFIEIYIYSTLKIAKRTLWVFQTVSLFTNAETDSSVSRLNKISQTDRIRKRDAQSSPFRYPRGKRLHTSSQTSPPCKIKLSFSPPKIKVPNDDKSLSKEPENSPAVLKLEAEIPGQTATTYPPTPLCNINLSLSPSIQARSKGRDNLFLEEGSFLKRKWQSWKLKQYFRKTKFQSLFLNHQRNSDGIFTCSENTEFSEWSPDNHNKKIFAEELDSPNKYGCCGSFVTLLKYKVHPESDCPVVTYKRF